MSRPVRLPHTSIPAFRKRLPADLRGKATGREVRIHFPAHGHNPECTVTATLGGSEVKRSLHTRDPRVATARSGIAKDHLQRLFASLRSGPTRLTQKQVSALAGAWSRSFVGGLEDDPGPVEAWVHFWRSFEPEAILEQGQAHKATRELEAAERKIGQLVALARGNGRFRAGWHLRGAAPQAA